VSEPLLETADRLAKVLAEHAASVDAQARFPVEGVRALRESGFLGLLVPRAFGGLEADLPTFSAIAQRLAGSCLSTAMVWAMHCQQVAILVAHAGPELEASLLPRLGAGKVYLASITTDPSNGGDPLVAQSPLLERGANVAFSRESPVVTGGENADGYLLTLKASEAATPAQVVFAYADRAQVELTQVEPWALMGMRGTRNVKLTISGQVPRTQVLGLGGAGPDIVADTLVPMGHIAWASCWLGAARGLLVQMLQALRADPRRRRALASDLLAVKMGDVELKLDAAEVYLRRVVDDYQRVRTSPQGTAELRSYEFHRRLNGLKVLAASTAFAAVDALLEDAGFRGGYLQSAPLPVERVFRDLRSASLMVPNERLLLLNGRTLLMGWGAQ